MNTGWALKIHFQIVLLVIFSFNYHTNRITIVSSSKPKIELSLQPIKYMEHPNKGLKHNISQNRHKQVDSNQLRQFRKSSIFIILSKPNDKIVYYSILHGSLMFNVMHRRHHRDQQSATVGKFNVYFTFYLSLVSCSFAFFIGF